MPLYDYESDDGSIIEVFYHMKDDKPEQLERDGVLYKRVFMSPRVGVDSKKPKTIGDLGRKNTERAIKEGTIDKPKAKEKPWWRKSKKVDTSLAKMTAKQKEKYIITGKK